MDESTFVDRVAGVRTAGIHSNLKNNTSRNSDAMTACLNHEVTEHEGRTLGYKTALEDYKLPPPSVNIYRGFNTEVKECVQPDANQSYLTALEREFQHTVYDSYWKKRVGRSSDPTPMLPAGMEPGSTLFGKPTPQDISAGELVSPPKGYLDVVQESEVGHEMYRQTHNDYYPGEQVDRNYVKPFRKDLVFGGSTPSDPQGGCMKKVMNTGGFEKIFVSKILADHRTRTKDLVGRVLAPNNNIACVPPGHAFGKLNRREPLGAGELLKDCPPSLDKVDLYEELNHVNTLRQQIAHKYPSPLTDMMDAFHLADCNNTGCLPIEEVYKILSNFLIFPEKPLFEGLLSRLNILCDNGMVSYSRLSDVLNTNAEFPDITKIDDVPKEILNFETTYQNANKYHRSEGFDTKNIPAAGKPPDPYVAIEGIVSPNIFSNYGLTPKDFLISRTPDYMRTLFQRIGCNLDDNTFEKIWDLAKDEKGHVSVHTFFNSLKSYK